MCAKSLRTQKTRSVDINVLGELSAVSTYVGQNLATLLANAPILPFGAYFTNPGIMIPPSTSLETMGYLRSIRGTHRFRKQWSDRRWDDSFLEPVLIS